MALVQSISANTGQTTPCTMAFGSNNTVENLIVVVVRITGGSSSTPTDTRGNTYNTAVANQQIGSSASTLSLYYAMNIGAGANTVSIAFTGGSTAPRIAIFEYSGLALNSALDQAVGASGGGSNNIALQTSGPVTTTNADDLALGVIAWDIAQNISAGTGYTIRECITAAATASLATEDQILTSTQSIAATWNGTIVSTPDRACIIATFKAAPGGPSATRTMGYRAF